MSVIGASKNADQCGVTWNNLLARAQGQLQPKQLIVFLKVTSNNLFYTMNLLFNIHNDDDINIKQR